jgi:ABC-type transport system involved in multi-copper enzyme maturation permease subunit
MLWTLIRKEMLANVTSLRFALTLLLVMVVFVVSGFVFVGKYERETEDFTDTSSKNLAGLEEASENLSSVPNYVQTIRKRPKITQLCCEGFEKSMPNTVKVSGFEVQNPESVSRTNFLFPRFADIDWAFIISLILSFVAFLMTFDSLSAERERGTLRVIMSNSVPRDKVILGKYVSGMLTLMIPLFAGLLLNLIAVRFSGSSFISSEHWVRVLAFVGISILYLSTFVLLGMLVSSRSGKSSSSIVILLFVWVIVAMIIPSAGRIIAERFVQVPARSEVERQISEAGREIWENSDRYGKNAGSWGGNPRADWVNPPARARLFNALADSRNRINEEHVNKMAAQVSLGRNVTRVSPTVMYQCASEAMMGTGVLRFRSLYNQLKRYKETLKDFVMAVDKKDLDSFHLWAPGRQHQILLSQNPVDYNAIPRFEEIDAPMSSALRDAVWDIGALALLNILLFMGVYISFLKSDVR